MIFNEELTSEERFHRGATANTPHLNPLPQGERRGKKQFTITLQKVARLPRRMVVRCGKMLLKSGSGWPIYVSTKRTQFIWREKHGLSDCEANGSSGKFSSKKLGSFSKTNPIWRLFMTCFGSIYAINDGF